MKVVKARVESIVDQTETGKFLALIGPKFDPGDPQEIILTSPFFLRYEAGILAVPAKGSEILVFYDEDTSDYYYISTVVDHVKWGGITNRNEQPLIEKYIYNKKFRPQAMTFKDGNGAGLKITNLFTDNSEPIINHVTLKSTQGHVLKLSDSPNKDCVILRNKDGDGITITANKNTVYPSNSINIETKGNYNCVSHFGEIFMGLVEGRDVTITNQSAGYAAAPLPYGNVNLISRWKDINIYTDGGTGDVLISAPLGLVQLRGDTVTVYANSVNVNSVADINLKSVGGNINLDAGGQINLNSVAGVNITSQGPAVFGGAIGTSVGLIGTPLALNSAIQLTPPNLNIGIPQLNDYGK